MGMGFGDDNCNENGDGGGHGGYAGDGAIEEMKIMDPVPIVDCCLDGLSDNLGDGSGDDLGDGSGDDLGDGSDVGDGIDDVDGEDGLNGGGGELREAFTRIKIMELKEEVGGSFTGG